MDRVTATGKFFRLGGQKWFVKGFSYGPFSPNQDEDPLPEPGRLREDFAHMRRLGANCVRVYVPPPRWLLDEALEHDLRVFVDVPWEKHRCFFEDWHAQAGARERVRHTARTLGDHPAVFAISVVNEIPADVVRFYGHRRVGRFVDQLLDSAKQEAPDCLTTFVNFPTTEFLTPRAADFCCFNVYVHDDRKLGAYLDRLQHIAENKPLVLGEYGVDTIREGDVEQAAMLSRHTREVFRHGLAGSFIFSYTDDWYTGGHQIEDWAFGVTDVSREEKPSAVALRQSWMDVPHRPADDLPKVSVIVCSYNGGSTLEDCLQSLTRLDYPDYEIILVDDGSTDDTPRIAQRYGDVIYYRQRNEGLSVARNVGAYLAAGEIVAYTDSDCQADEHWLRYLVQAMRDQGVEAIGGPNITPESDGWIAKCITACPGHPSHVMLDDQRAEHVPGCNMAFRRETLLGLGGFDAQFRQAGDDVDICWRLLDADLPIGYAPGAMVWHRRRVTVRAYRHQQRGYGRSEAMVQFKHPQRCDALGRSRWHGIIYGDGAVGLPLMPETIYHGRFGTGLFQTIYRHNRYGLWSVLMSLEWHLMALFGLLLALTIWPMALVSLVMWTATVAVAARSAWQAPLPKDAPWWCRLVVLYLHIMQPVWRGWNRMTFLLRSRRRLPETETPITRGAQGGRRVERGDQPFGEMPPPGQPGDHRPPWCAGPRLGHLRKMLERIKEPAVKAVSSTEWDLYWHSDEYRGRGDLLPMLVETAQAARWRGDFDNAWARWDVKLVGDCWHDILIHTATEELGWPHRFTRARCAVRLTRFSRVVSVVSIIWIVASAYSQQHWAMLIGFVVACWCLARIRISRNRCLRAASRLVAVAGDLAGLGRVDSSVRSEGTEPPPERPSNPRDRSVRRQAAQSPM